MDPLPRLKRFYRDPAALGLTTPEELAAELKALVNGVDSLDDEVVFLTVRAELISVELSQLLQNPDEFRAPSGLTIKQAVADKVTALTSERNRCLGLLAGLTGDGGDGSGSSSVPIVWTF